MDSVPELAELHNALLGMLIDIDKICRKHGIKYFLICGSLLGAIRHNGFIPWDDDLDIGFLREDYEHFLDIADGELDDKKYYLQKGLSKDWKRTFSKVRLNGTTLIEKTVFPQNVHQGLFIDLFPIDNLSNSRFIRNIQWRSYKIIENKYSDMFNPKRDLKKKLKHALSCIVPNWVLLKLIMLRKKQNTKMVHMYLGAAAVRNHNEFYRDDFKETIDHIFENMTVKVPNGWDRVLKIEFNDYMKIPPVEKQIARIHGQYFSLNKDYKEYFKEVNNKC